MQLFSRKFGESTNTFIKYFITVFYKILESFPLLRSIASDFNSCTYDLS